MNKIQPLETVPPSGLGERKKRNIVRYVATGLIVLGFGLAWYYHNAYEAIKANPAAEEQAQAQQEVKALVAKVSQLMVLPANETPTVATITNADQLKNQPFFANAQNGDKLLAYMQAKEAILYRPSINKIIEVAPVVINSNQITAPAPASTTSSSQK